MRIAVSSPLGSLSEETGLVYLLTNYVRSLPVDLVQLRCNGAFSSCDRDAESNWQRSIESCVQCMYDQSTLASWSGIDTIDMTTYIEPAEVEETRKWMISVDANDLISTRIGDSDGFELCRGTFKNRFGLDDPNLLNRHHELFLRKLMLSASRMCIAAKRFIDDWKPELIFIPGGRDFMTKTLLSEAKRAGCGVVLFQWSLEERCVRIIHPRTNQVLSCELILHGISTMRSDSRTWPIELISILNDILNFLDMPKVDLLMAAAR